MSEVLNAALDLSLLAMESFIALYLYAIIFTFINPHNESNELEIAPTIKVQSSYQIIDVSNLHRDDLRRIAKDHKISNYSRMSKKSLMEAVSNLPIDIFGDVNVAESHVLINGLNHNHSVDNAVADLSIF